MIFPYSGVMRVILCPSLFMAFDRLLETSAKPPLFEKGEISDDIRVIFSEFVIIIY